MTIERAVIDETRVQANARAWAALQRERKAAGEMRPALSFDSVVAAFVDAVGMALIEHETILAYRLEQLCQRITKVPAGMLNATETAWLSAYAGDADPPTQTVPSAEDEVEPTVQLDPADGVRE